MKHQPSDNSLALDHDLKVSPPVVETAATTGSRSRWYHFTIPEWISTNIRSKRSLKVVLRCSIACWAAYVIILPNPAIRAIGTISFFSLLTSFFVPPYLPVQLYFFIMSTLMIGVLIAWGFGMAAMRAANASRDPSVLAAALATVNASIQANPAYQQNPALAKSVAIVEGVFLDEKASAVYGCFLGLTTFLMAMIRAYAPTLIFMSIFGTIAIDIFCTVGPLFPTHRYSLIHSMIISISAYFAIGLVSTILIFPETMNHAILNDFSEQVERLKALISAQDEIFSIPGDRLEEEVAELNQRTRMARSKIVEEQTQLVATSRFIHLEFNWGKWSADDVMNLFDPLLTLVVRIASLQSFGQMLCRSQHMLDPQSESPNAPDTSDAFLLQQIRNMNHEVEERNKVRVADILPVLDESTKEMRAACYQGLESIKRSLDHVNRCRWKTNPDLDGSTRDSLEADTRRLQAALHAFKVEHRLELVQPFIPIVERHPLTNAMPLRSLYLCYVFGTAMVGVTEAILALMILVGDTMEKRKKSRLWAPTRLRQLWNIVSTHGDKNNGVFGDDVSPHAPGKNTVSAKETASYHRDPDSSAPSNPFQKLARILSLVWKWMETPEFIFAIKYVILSIALWVPAVVNNTAHFYYREKGVWALIMAQTMINLYTADQIFNLVTRLLGTVVGLLMGLAAWYMGNGSGNGSPYGTAAAYALFIPFVVFVRVYTPFQYVQGVVLGCATFALVVGYSWVDGHTVQVVTPGIGWTLAWRRWILVVIGCVASSIIMFFFSPVSGRKAVRLRNAASITSISRLYAQSMSAWISNSEDSEEKKQWLSLFRQKAMTVYMEMRTIRELTDLVKWEGSIRGKWSQKEYAHLVDSQIEMISSLVQLGGAIVHLDDAWRVAFLKRTGVLNPNFISDVMSLFTIVSQSLQTAQPLHEVLPDTLLEKLFYHQQHSDNDHESLTVDHVKSEDYMYYAAGVVAIYQLLHALDSIRKTTKHLCGEEPMKGFSRWKTDFQQSKASGL